jgi:hypothetical protein
MTSIHKIGNSLKTAAELWLRFPSNKQLSVSVKILTARDRETQCRLRCGNFQSRVRIYFTFKMNDLCSSKILINF